MIPDNSYTLGEWTTSAVHSSWSLSHNSLTCVGLGKSWYGTI